MNFYIRVDGQDGKTPVSLENLLQKGVVKQTWICIEGTEDWDVAENFRELDNLWQPQTKEKKVSKIISPEQNSTVESMSQSLSETEEKRELSSSIISGQSQDNVEIGVPSESTKDFFPKYLLSPAVKRMIVFGAIIFAILYGLEWAFKHNKKPSSTTENNPDNTEKIIEKEMNKLIIEGIADVDSGRHYSANLKFFEVMKFLEKNAYLNRTRIDSLAQRYRQIGNEMCDSNNSDIAQSYYNHAALLSNTKPQICR
jgi:hypothetical protein